MDNIFIDRPKEYLGKPLISFGAKHDEFRLALDCVANRQKDAELFIVEGLWVYGKIVEMKIEVGIFMFCPEYIITEQDMETVKGMIRIAGKSGYISESLCQRLTDRDSSEGSFAVYRYPKTGPQDIRLSENNVVMILDGLEKPGNIGTIIRSTEGAGGDAVIYVNGKVRMTHNRVIMSSLGGSLTLPVFEMSADDCVKWLAENGFAVYLTELDGEHLFCEDGLYEGRVAIVAGNEIRGVSGIWRESGLKTVGVRIPMYGRCDSLNVGFAATMVAYEATLRQKGLRSGK